MIAEQMRKLFAYNNWAWQHVFRSVEQLDTAAYKAQRLLFSGSIHATLVHAAAAEQIWLERCRGNSPTAMLDPDEIADFASLMAQWREISHGWGNYVQWLKDDDLQREVAYHNTRGHAFSLPLVDIMQHVVNHATEHRSQITPYLYDLGVPTEPLDYMFFRLGR